MQDVANVTADHATARMAPRPGRLTWEELSAAAPDRRAAGDQLPRELLDTRLVRAELLRLRGPTGGERSAISERRV